MIKTLALVLASQLVVGLLPLASWMQQKHGEEIPDGGIYK